MHSPARRGPRRGWWLLALSLLITAASTLGPVAADEAGPVDQSAQIAGIETYLNSIATMKARFLQVAEDGTLATGDFYLRRPGRLRFEYDPPVPILVVADSIWIVLEDSELRQVDRLPLSSTPLSILVADEVSLGDGAVVSEISASGGLLQIALRDTENPDEGVLTLVFDARPLRLRQWLVTDSLGQTTEITLSDLEINIPLDPRLFVYDEPEFRKRKR